MPRIALSLLVLAVACRRAAPGPATPPPTNAATRANVPAAPVDVPPPRDAPPDAAPDATLASNAPDAAAPRARLVFAQTGRNGGERWADPWSITLEVASLRGPPRVYAVGDLSLTSPDYGPCPASPGEVDRYEGSWPVGGGSFNLTLTLRGRTIAWDFVESAEGDDPRGAGSTRHARGRAEVPAGVPADRVVVECR